jgi:hypothetical protein
MAYSIHIIRIKCLGVFGVSIATCTRMDFLLPSGPLRNECNLPYKANIVVSSLQTCILSVYGYLPFFRLWLPSSVPPTNTNFTISQIQIHIESKQFDQLLSCWCLSYRNTASTIRRIWVYLSKPGVQVVFFCTCKIGQFDCVTCEILARKRPFLRNGRSTLQISP